MAIALVTLLLLPAFKKLQTFILRHYVLKDLLCLQAINIALETFLILLIVKADNFLSFTLHYIARTFAFNCGELFL